MKGEAMAKGGSKTRQPSAPADIVRTTEDLNDDQLAMLAWDHKKKIDAIQTKIKTLQADMGQAKKLAKKEMGVDALEILKDLKDLETGDGDKKLTNAVRRILRSARWAGSKLGTQFELLEQVDRTPLVDKAYEDGKRAAMKGERADCPHDTGTAARERWLEGYGDGNAEKIRATIKPMTPPAGSTDQGIGGTPPTLVKQ